MFERFTDRARKSVVWAQEEARILNHNYIGTEHLLLGLFHEDEGLAAQALTSLGSTIEDVREAVEQRVGRGSQVPKGHIPFTPRAKKVLELALREALKLQHNYIGTEHILLGVITEGEGVAAQILMTGIDGGLERVRATTIGLLGATIETVEGRGKSLRRPFGRRESGTSLVHASRDLMVRLEAIEARLSAIEYLLRKASGTEAS